MAYISKTIENLKKLMVIINKIDEINALHPLDIDFEELDSLTEESQQIKAGIEASLDEIKTKKK